MHSRRARIDDVARLSGVSIKTVSRVLNQEPNVRPATRERVLAAASSLNYRRNLPARQLASKQSFVIGMLYDNPNSEYVTTVQNGSLEVCREFGYNLLINPSRADSNDLIREVLDLAHQVDGFIVLQPLSDLAALNELLRERRIAAVRVSQRAVAGFPLISVGDADASDEMTEHLLDLGHRRIGFIVGHPDHGQSLDRLAGYRSALERRRLAFDESLVEQGHFDFESGHECARRLLASDSPPTAIFASNDPMAMGVYSAARERGLDVPRDLSVTGFDDAPMARHACPPLTTVRQPIEQVARLATELLLRRLRNSEDGGDEHHRLKAELICRESTAAPA